MDLQDYETSFCASCSLSKIPTGACAERLYPQYDFYNYDKFATENYPDGKKCDVLGCNGHNVILFELKALNWFLGLRKQGMDLDAEISTLRKILLEKFENSAKIIVEKNIIKHACFPYYVVVFSKDIIRRGKSNNVNVPFLKYYIQSKIFPFPFRVNLKEKSTSVLVRECVAIEDVLAKVGI